MNADGVVIGGPPEVGNLSTEAENASIVAEVPLLRDCRTENLMVWGGHGLVRSVPSVCSVVAPMSGLGHWTPLDLSGTYPRIPPMCRFPSAAQRHEATDLTRRNE
jgi:hypothetical protein